MSLPPDPAQQPSNDQFGPPQGSTQPSSPQGPFGPPPGSTPPAAQGPYGPGPTQSGGQYGPGPSPYGPGPTQGTGPYGPAPSPYAQPTPYGPSAPTAPSHLGANGSLQSFGALPGGGPRPGAGYYQPGQGPQPVVPSWGRSQTPVVTPKRSRTGLLVGIAALVVVALVAVIGVGGGYLGRLLAAPSPTPSTTPTVRETPTATASPTSSSTSVISKPPVPSPTATTQRSYNSPDRPHPAIPAVKPAGFIDPPAGSGMSRYTGQQLAWSSCTVSSQQVECATVAAPLDYTAPDGQAITLNLVKVAATASPKLGTIFVNPGGPGEPGSTLAVSFQRKGLEQYDIVGWDPRGTGKSTPVVCEDGKAVDALRALDASPDTAAEKQALIDGWKQFGLSCLAKSGALLEHISTLDTVKDLDMLRQLVGDPKLNYLGYSYGTYIGAVYAQEYPSLVGRMVLDSAVNITQDESVSQPAGFDLALGNYAEWCAQQGCSLGSTKAQVLSTITTMLDKLDSSPLPATGGRQLTQSIASDGIALFMYVDSTYWDQLTQAIEKTLAGDGRYLLYYGDQMWNRQDDGSYDTLYYAFPAISCADSQDDGIARAYADWALTEKQAPIFGKYMGPNLTCTVWPVQGQPPMDITAKGAAPIVVVGATGDSATPYQYARWMADQLDSGVLVTWNGNGHATYGGKSQCVDNAVVAYFAKDTVPPDGLYCTT